MQGFAPPGFSVTRPYDMRFTEEENAEKIATLLADKVGGKYRQTLAASGSYYYKQVPPGE